MYVVTPLPFRTLWSQKPVQSDGEANCVRKWFAFF